MSTGKTISNFVFIFSLDLINFNVCKQRARIMVGLEHPTIRLRGGDVTTSPPLPPLRKRYETSKNVWVFAKVYLVSLNTEKNSKFYPIFKTC